MANFTPDDLRRVMRGLRWPLGMTRLGMFAETLVQSFWPLAALALLVLAALMMGLADYATYEMLLVAAGIVVVAGLAALIYAVRQLRWPTKAQAMARLDTSLKGRPLSALLDDQAIGGDDEASAAVWRAHKARMAERAGDARAVPGDLRVASRDPFALRYVAMLAFGVALLFGSLWRVNDVSALGQGGDAIASGPVWEGWAEPPKYTGLPTLYLNDLAEGDLTLPAGTLISLRLYGEVGALSVAETVSGSQAETAEWQAKLTHDFKIAQDGEIAIDGENGRRWQVVALSDAPPEIEIVSLPDVDAMGEMTLPFVASDDYGVEAGEALISLDLAEVDRRYGLSPSPDPRPDLTVQLPLPISGSRADFEENLIDDFSQHPWANLPVTITLSALDASEQKATTKPMQMRLPGRRFFDPVASAVIEMRRDLLWSRTNADQTAQILRAISYLPEDVFRVETAAGRIGEIVASLEKDASLEPEQQEELAKRLWELAIELEEGDLNDALERMRRAKERLEEAMKNGASDQEIAELMQELRRATDEYMQQLQRQQAQEQSGDDQAGQQGDSMQMTQDDLQRMMDRIQELMEQGRMAEAEQALRELQQMMENMRVTEGQQGKGGQSPGDQAMEDLAETLREQQGLSDQAFRDLQEQHNPGAKSGQSQNNEGRSGGSGRGQDHEGQGQGGSESGEQQGQGGAEGDSESTGEDSSSLADRQQALRDELNKQKGNLPGQGTPEGDAARDALDRAGRSMDRAEENLRQGDLAEAIDNQSKAMEALREGMRDLADAMDQQSQGTQSGQGGEPTDRRANNRDPLGREQGTNGADGSDADVALNGDPQGRARELLDEIRRRSGQTSRPELELDYLKRLLDRF